MAKTYVAERQVEWWTSAAVEDYFQDRGYKCEALPIDQGVEKQIPADFAFKSDPPVKLFGFQYKVLYQNGADHWRLDANQHQQLSFFSWIYYGLSEIKSASDRSGALHALRIKRPNFAFSKSLKGPACSPYMRWHPFFTRLMSCQNGERVTSASRLTALLNPRRADISERFLETIGSIFLLDRVSRTLLSFSSDRDRQSAR